MEVVRKIVTPTLTNRNRIWINATETRFVRRIKGKTSKNELEMKYIEEEEKLKILGDVNRIRKD